MKKKTNDRIEKKMSILNVNRVHKSTHDAYDEK